MAQVMTSAGIQITYDDRKREVIQRNLKALMRSVRAGDIAVGFLVSGPLHVLGEFVRIEGIDDDDVKQHVIFTAAIHLQSLADIGIAELVEAVGVAAQNYLSRPMQLYHVMLPLNVEGRLLSEVAKFSIQGVALTRETWPTFQKEYAHDRLTASIQDYLKYDMPDNLWNWSGIPLVAQVTARNPGEAFSKASDAYEILRAVFNVVHDASPIQLQRREPLASANPAAAYGVFFPDGRFAEAFIDVEQLSFQNRFLTPSKLASVLEMLDRLFADGRPASTIKIYLDALRAYNRGLDATNWQNAYLSLWQSLEVMTTFDLRGTYRMEDVVKRTKVLLTMDDDVLSDFLNLCADRRNSLVHRGLFSEDGQSNVLLLKAIARACLVRFLQLAKGFPSQVQLSEYFLRAHLTSEELSQRKQAIETILSEKDRIGEEK
jgi:hypothetical protein